MDAIKKSMQTMKKEKDAAMDKADTCENQARDANFRADKVRKLFLYLIPTYIEMNSYVRYRLYIIERSFFFFCFSSRLYYEYTYR